MSKSNDPRTRLVHEKYFSLHPKPLERWLWRQSLPQTAERVFWLHWEEGMRNGDWCSEIPLKRVARECCVDSSTVTRAYQLLKSHGLIRREDPGRNPNNPFCQATAITEVRLPREFISEFAQSPNRSSRPKLAQASSAQIPTLPAPASTPAGPPITPPARRPSREDTRAMWGRASDTERTRFFAASRDRLTTLEFDPDTKLTAEDRAQILAQLAQLASARPTPSPLSPTMPQTPAVYGPRRLSVLELARTRKRLLETVPGAAAPEIFRQVIWAVEEGALRRFDPRLAINIALKKIREGAWTCPNRMPPQWLRPAAPETCSAA